MAVWPDAASVHVPAVLAEARAFNLAKISVSSAQRPQGGSNLPPSRAMTTCSQERIVQGSVCFDWVSPAVSRLMPSCYVAVMTPHAYADDILIGAEQQATLLRRLAAGERVNEAIDWPHVIEEVEDLGGAELHVRESLLRQAMLRLIEVRAGAEQSEAHGRSEILGLLGDVAARFTPSMRQKRDLDGIFRMARRQAVAARTPHAALLPDICPWPLDELLAEQTDLDHLLAALP
jgi:hypothetical protein